MKTFIDSFIQALAAEQAGDNVYNQYAPGDPDNAIRRANFRRYLLEMQQRKVQHLLVMEAPGYRGCRLTGVPVTSRKILLEGLPELKLFGKEQGYQATDDAGFENVYGEQSATIVWKTLAKLRVTPLIWNSFPFHPHQPDQARSNRRPRKSELRTGAAYLKRIIEHFQPKKIIAVGNVAHETLIDMEINAQKIRHPAQGGKNDFVAGLEAIFGD